MFVNDCVFVKRMSVGWVSLLLMSTIDVSESYPVVVLTSLW